MSNLSDLVQSHVRAESGRIPQAATETEFWSGLSRVVVDAIAQDWEATTKAYAATRQQHYFSAEFLMGRALLNNLLNTGLVDEASAAVEKYGKNLTDVLEAEHDAALGNGGLGRLAACFLDSCATQNLPVTGYGILYRYGLFKQTFDNGFQNEHPDPWMEEGYPFVIRREELAKIVSFDDLVVRAVPYDMPITGYGTNNVGTLRLWHSEPMQEFDYDAFNSQRFTDAIVERERRPRPLPGALPQRLHLRGQGTSGAATVLLCLRIAANHDRHLCGKSRLGFEQFPQVQLDSAQ